MKRVLVIKHGSLGDIVFSLPVMHSIKAYYSNASIDLLTEKKYFNFLSKANYFDSLIEDNRPNNIIITISLLIELLKRKYDLIIDLQNSSRTSYYHLFFRIFSNVRICSSRKFSHIKYSIPIQGTETTTQGLFNQIKLLEIPEIINIQYNWLKSNLDERYNNKTVLFIPGVSIRGKHKQWDPKKFSKLAKYCEDKNYQICIVGTNQDSKSVIPILKNCKNLINNIDHSPPDIIYSISKISTLIVTNDTGPGHIAALSGNNILWLVNDNKVTKANIGNQPNNYKILSSYVNDITTQEVINFIEKKKLL